MTKKTLLTRYFDKM
jgi:hypothetical protein